MPGGGSGRGACGLRGLAAPTSPRRARRRTSSVPGSRPDPSRSLFSVDMLPNAVRARRPIGMATAPTPSPVCDTIDSQRRRRSAAARRRRTAATSTTMAPPEAIRLRSGSPTSAPIQPPARPNVSKSAMIFSGPRTTCSKPEQRQARAAPNRCASRNAVRAAALADQGDADGDQRDGHDEPTEPGEPADDGLDAATERTGQIEVDGQAQQHADGDEADPGELVLATLDRLAELGRGLPRRDVVDGDRPPSPAWPAAASAWSSSSTASWVDPTSS